MAKTLARVPRENTILTSGLVQRGVQTAEGAFMGAGRGMPAVHASYAKSATASYRFKTQNSMTVNTISIQ